MVDFDLLINKVIHFLNKDNVEVIFLDYDNNDVAGFIVYKDKKIFLSRLANPKEVFLTLIHEAGHWISYTRYYLKQRKKQESFTEDERENFAYLYGWYVIRQNNLDRYISKIQWRDFSNT